MIDLVIIRFITQIFFVANVTLAIKFVEETLFAEDLKGFAIG